LDNEEVIKTYEFILRDKNGKKYRSVVDSMSLNAAEVMLQKNCPGFIDGSLKIDQRKPILQVCKCSLANDENPRPLHCGYDLMSPVPLEELYQGKKHPCGLTRIATDHKCSVNAAHLKVITSKNIPKILVVLSGQKFTFIDLNKCHGQ